MATTRDPGPDPLLELQLRIAHRADELAIDYPERTPLNLPCWLQAEEEILGPLRLSFDRKEWSPFSSFQSGGRKISPARANIDSPAPPA